MQYKQYKNFLKNREKRQMDKIIHGDIRTKGLILTKQQTNRTA